MDTGREDIESLLADHPGLADDLEEILALDSEGTWKFADIPLDSGTFGEVVSRGIAVESEQGEYRLDNREAVQAALGYESEESSQSSTPTVSSRLSHIDIPLSRQTAMVLGGLLVAVVFFRVAFIYDSVYRESITLLGNDPYKRLYWVEQLQQYPAFDVGSLSKIPEKVRLKGDTLMLVTMWWVSELLGGTAQVARQTLAWYPVGAAVITAGAVYATARKLTDDVRVAGASALLLAVTPVHGFRTALGFGDHHAFDYIWLALTMFVVVWWETHHRDQRGSHQFGSRRFWAVGIALTVFLTIQTLSWVGSAIHLIPFGAFVVVRGAIALYESYSPATETVPYLGSLGIASLLVLGIHTGLDWLPLARALVPLLVFAFSAGVIGFLEGGRYLSISPRRTLFSGVVIVTVTALGVVLSTSLLTPLVERAIGLFRAKPIAESAGLFGTETGSFVLPLFLFGLTLFLAIPFIAIGVWRTIEYRDARWAAPSVYAIYFLFWSAVKIRFAGPLSLFTSIFAGWGLVRLAAWVDIARPVRPFDRAHIITQFQRPDTHQLISIVILFLLVGGFGIVQTPIKQGQLTVDDSTYQTSQWIAEYSNDNDMEYPDNGVFSRWDETRVYNYFVNGQSRSYGYEQRNYGSFLGSTDPGKWYDRLRDRYGFVVFKQPRNGTSGPTIENRIMANDNTEPTLPGFDHYRLVYTVDNGPQRVFELVTGSTVVGVERTNDTATIATEVTVSGKTYVYQQQVSTNPYGLYSVTVPYPAEYSLGPQSVTITEADIRNGSRITKHSREGLLHWPFDATDGRVVYDRVGGIRGDGSNLTVTNESIHGGALEFDRAENSHLQAEVRSPDEFTVSTWIKPRAIDRTDDNDYRNIVRSGAGLFVVLEEDGRVSLRIPGTEADPIAGGNVTVDEWHHIVATYDGSEYALYINGSQVANGTVEGATPSWNGRLGVGRGNERHTFDGIVDEFRIYERALGGEAIRERFSRLSNRTAG